MNLAARLLITAIVVALVGSCGDDGPSWPDQAARAVVAVRAQPCETPNRSSGFGVHVGGGLVVTAAHTVEGTLRALDVDGSPAAVVAIDRRTDLALLHVDGETTPSIDLLESDLAGASPLWLLVSADAGTSSTRIDAARSTQLTVHATTAGERYVREAIAVPGAVAAGTSGAPLVTADGRLAGIVVIAVASRDRSYAVAASEVRALLATEQGSSLEPAQGCA